MKQVFTFLCMFALSACFVSEAPLIPAGKGVKPVRGTIKMCDASECYTGKPSGDGYEVRNPANPDDPDRLHVRFTRLTKGAQPVYLAEMNIEKEADEGSGIWYTVARANKAGGIDMQTPSCSASDPEAETARAAHGLARVDQWSCSAADLKSLKAALLALHQDDFDDDAFWRPAPE